MTRLDDMAREELARHPKTLVAVGGDVLISRLASLIIGSKTPLGIIPVGKSIMADAFGINLENACRILAARRIIELDVGRIDGQQSFLGQAIISTVNPSLVLDGELKVEVEGQALVEIVNLLGDEYGYRGAAPQADDGKLNIYILKSAGSVLKKDISQSSFVCRRISFKKGVTKIVLDGGIELKSIKEVEIVPKLLSAIVGKERKF
jgi:hypothetical protein